jgi:hypothetical protein
MMPALTAADILRAWEWGRDRHPVDQALVMLSAAYADASPEELMRLPVGERDARLLAVRAATFGEYIECTGECPHCSVAVEFALRSGELAGEPPRVPRTDAPMEVEQDGMRLRVRAPNSYDLAAIANAADAPVARDRLLRRCVAGLGDGDPVDPAQLPADVIGRLEARLAELDPQADITFAVRCPACGHGWELIFDIAAFLWTEIAAAAGRIAGEVHALARAYGWCEADILAMSPARRRLYLDLAG